MVLPKPSRGDTEPITSPVSSWSVPEVHPTDVFSHITFNRHSYELKPRLGSLDIFPSSPPLCSWISENSALQIHFSPNPFFSLLNALCNPFRRAEVGSSLSFWPWQWSRCPLQAERVLVTRGHWDICEFLFLE